MLKRKVIGLLEKLVLIGSLLIPLSSQISAQEPIITYNHTHANAAGTTIYVKWIDRDGDKMPDWGEFEEENKASYGRSEIINLMMHLPSNQNPGGNFKTVTTSPKGVQIVKDIAVFPRNDSWMRVRTDNASLYDHSQAGPGQYKVEFYVNNRLFQTRWFDLVDDGTSVRPFRGNFIPNRENWNQEGVLNNIVGLNKGAYKKNEAITIGAVSSYHKGETAKVRFLNPRGDEFHSFTHEINQDNYYFFWKFASAEELSKKYGLGTYSAFFEIGDKKFGKIEFEVIE